MFEFLFDLFVIFLIDFIDHQFDIILTYLLIFILEEFLFVLNLLFYLLSLDEIKLLCIFSLFILQQL